jgi:hypothetical protein
MAPLTVAVTAAVMSARAKVAGPAMTVVVMTTVAPTSKARVRVVTVVANQEVTR